METLHGPVISDPTDSSQKPHPVVTINSFEIKGTQLTSVALIIKSSDLAQVSEDLLAQYGPAGESAGFFDGDLLVLDFQRLVQADVSGSIADLVQTLDACRLRAVAFRHASDVIAAACLACGLAAMAAEIPRKPAIKQAPRKAAAAVETVPEVAQEVVREVVREVAAPGALVIDKPLRSGQKIYARGADLVMLAMVNAGAEVVADGNIHVYAPLRGKAMAGASGNTQARIFSLCMEPELISIAGIYRTSEQFLPKNIQGKPAQVRLSTDGGDKLLFDPLNF